MTELFFEIWNALDIYLQVAVVLITIRIVAAPIVGLICGYFGGIDSEPGAAIGLFWLIYIWVAMGSGVVAILHYFWSVIQ